MGNKPSAPTSESATPLVKSRRPNAIITSTQPEMDTTDWVLKTSKDNDARPHERLPEYVVLRLTPSHCELWTSDGMKKMGKAPLKTLSYFSLLGWGHSNRLFRLIMRPDEQVNGQRAIEFETNNGQLIEQVLGGHCTMLAQEVTEHSEKLKQQQEDHKLAWHAYSSRKRAALDDVHECPSPLMSNSRASRISPMDLEETCRLSGPLECDLDRLSPVTPKGSSGGGNGNLTFDLMDLPELMSPHSQALEEDLERLSPCSSQNSTNEQLNQDSGRVTPRSRQRAMLVASSVQCH